MHKHLTMYVHYAIIYIVKRNTYKRGRMTMDNYTIQNMIDNRPDGKDRGWSLYTQLGLAIESVPTLDLIRFYVEVIMQGHDTGIRDMVENQIVAWLINREKAY